MFEKVKLWFVLAVSILLLIYFAVEQGIFSDTFSAFNAKESTVISLTPVNPEVKVLSADPSNRLVIQVYAATPSGAPVTNSHVKFIITGGGNVVPSNAKTDRTGQCIASYVPPLLSPDILGTAQTEVSISAEINGSLVDSPLKIKLANIPVVFVHGYLANGSVFTNMKDFFASNGIEGEAITYKSENGVAASSKELSEFLQKQRLAYLDKGIQVNKFNIIAHSMGGLVVRYYSCSNEYLKNNNIQKIIFLSVPHRGSPWASIGTTYYNDQGVKDMIPSSSLISKILPGMLNKGLNNTIQTGNIMAEYDEVVDPESASLEEWGINTEIFNVGESNFSMNNLLNGNLIQAYNHKSILSNTKVFERIYEMLNSQLPYPEKIR